VGTQGLLRVARATLVDWLRAPSIDNAGPDEISSPDELDQQMSSEDYRNAPTCFANLTLENASNLEVTRKVSTRRTSDRCCADD
jgi:hypothetical protein